MLTVLGTLLCRMILESVSKFALMLAPSRGICAVTLMMFAF